MDISRINLIILLKLSEIEMIKLAVTKRFKLNKLPLPIISFEIIKRSLKKDRRQAYLLREKNFWPQINQKQSNSINSITSFYHRSLLSQIPDYLTPSYLRQGALILHSLDQLTYRVKMLFGIFLLILSQGRLAFFPKKSVKIGMQNFFNIILGGFQKNSIFPVNPTLPGKRMALLCLPTEPVIIFYQNFNKTQSPEQTEASKNQIQTKKFAF